MFHAPRRSPRGTLGTLLGRHWDGRKSENRPCLQSLGRWDGCTPAVHPAVHTQGTPPPLGRCCSPAPTLISCTKLHPICIKLDLSRPIYTNPHLSTINACPS